MKHSASRHMDRQVVLPFGKSVEIAAKSISARFVRSLITTMSLILAVAFLCFVQVDMDLAGGLLKSGDPGLRQKLEASGFNLAPGQDSVGSTPAQRWLVALSLLVCVVGIINAQLMAVTERFREIGTMKCLGALDSFVLRLFLLEAAMQGLAGAGIGALCGAFFAILSSLFKFGVAVLVHAGWGDVALSMAVSTLTGCGLSLAGVLYPALAASRMQPVEAMRSEH